MPFDVIGLGLCAWDTLMLFDGYPGPNQKVDALASVRCGGGPVPTALAIFCRLGGSAAFIGAIGDRQEGLKIRCDLERYGVDVSNLMMRPNRRSPSAYVWVDKKTGDRTVALDQGDVEDVSIDELPGDLLRETPHLLIDGRDANICVKAAEICRDGGGKVVLDAGSPRQNIAKLLAVTDHAVVSEDFINGTFPGMAVDEALREIIASGPEVAVVTLGSRGGMWMERTKSGEYPSYQVPIVDTTGAGDAFHGAYLYGLKHKWDIEKRCRFAAAVAAIICTELGGRAAAPTYDQVELFIQEYQRKREIPDHE